jgi:hypothetical protein
LKIRDSVVLTVSTGIQNGVIVSIDFLEQSGASACAFHVRKNIVFKSSKWPCELLGIRGNFLFSDSSYVKMKR